ncbi:putative lipase/serine esterase [Penicillium brasilianum]|uniref:Putative lipase/serine esterase n=1 Tax=Penicillium brasilianum TaxID=104259 RepID=A0A1S9RN21_PENBI|nr:putative lipase/serine esterase [Penicillium brasilianum]
MLITPRTYSASQTPDQAAADSRTEGAPRFYTLAGWRQSPVEDNPTADMLLVHQTGSVRVGEIIRYTFTYTPAADPILPIPSELHVRVKNTSAIPLRAAYLHGPYTLYAACYPSTFDPNAKYDHQNTEGVPQFEPYLKAGGNWDATIKMPARFGDSHNLAVGHLEAESDRTVTWVIEIVSQVIFSSSAAVHFELLVARDAKSIEYFSAGGSATTGLGPPGKLQDHWPVGGTRGQAVIATKGVYSKSTSLRVDDTSSLWNSPPLPSWTSEAADTTPQRTDCMSQDASPEATSKAKPRKKRKVHLVVITHGLHSNLGADMLYLKESIDAAAAAKKKARFEDGMKSEDSAENYENDDDDEEVIVRGFSGNAVRTERGIQYLGKRLAKYVLLMTYPDQPYYPLKTGKSKSFPRPFSPRREQAQPSHEPLSTSANHENVTDGDDHAYKITSISFIGHSLGGLIQTYAIAYIQKHSPEFFDRIQPVNFIALASPFLGLSNENPLYVRFALDLGLVGRTGQDLGLSWTSPKVRTGWGAIIGGRGDSAKDQSHPDPGSKPLLRILPCGPAHEVLRKFHHRTVYSNVVNDGIVPLRTSCLLFLDWRGLDRVEKARRDNGIVGKMAEWGWAELTGANSKSPRLARPDEVPRLGEGQDGPKDGSAGLTEEAQRLQEEEDLTRTEEASSPAPEQFIARRKSSLHASSVGTQSGHKDGSDNNSGPLSTLLAFFRPKEPKHHHPSGKHAKIYKRSQTIASFDPNESPAPTVRGNSLYEEDMGVNTPPKTTFFESAGDLLMPPLPPTDFILDPAARPRTIFHDRIYHPEDIPAPLPVKRRTLTFASLQPKHAKTAPPQATQLSSSSTSNAKSSESGLKVEEKIARAYHRDLTWRKVLVRLEPDAHNNIIVRRMFTNAYGWPVVKHLVDTHFGHSPNVEVDDTLKYTGERAKALNVGPTSSGDEVEGQSDTADGSSTAEHERAGSDHTHGPAVSPSCSEGSLQLHDLADALPVEGESHETASTHTRSQSHYTDVSRQDSARWTDRQVDEDDDRESGLDVEGHTEFRWSPAPHSPA